MSDPPSMTEVNQAASRFSDRFLLVHKDSMDLPAKGEIETDLAKEKTEKDFKKKKKKWEDKLDALAKLHVKTHDALKEWQEKLQKHETAFKKWEKEKSDTDAQIRDVIKAIDKINSWLTQLGFDAVKKPDVDSWLQVGLVVADAQSAIDKEKDSVKEWRSKFSKHYGEELDSLRIELEQAKFKGAKGKGAPKAAKRR